MEMTIPGRFYYQRLFELLIFITKIIIRAVTIKNIKLLLSLRKVAIVKNEISFISNVKDRKNVSQEL